MKYSFHIGAFVVESVRIYQDLDYILVICEYLQHKILNGYGGEQNQLMHLHPLTTAYKCLQHICKDLLNFVKITQFSKFWGGRVYSLFKRFVT